MPAANMSTYLLLGQLSAFSTIQSLFV